MSQYAPSVHRNGEALPLPQSPGDMDMSADSSLEKDLSAILEADLAGSASEGVAPIEVGVLTFPYGTSTGDKVDDTKPGVQSAAAQGADVDSQLSATAQLRHKKLAASDFFPIGAGQGLLEHRAIPPSAVKTAATTGPPQYDTFGDSYGDNIGNRPSVNHRGEPYSSYKGKMQAEANQKQLARAQS